jgi:hypothetical protein
VKPTSGPAIRVDGPRGWDADITVRRNLTDGEPVTRRLRSGVLTHVTGTGSAVSAPDVEVTLAKSALRAVLLGTVNRPNWRSRPGLRPRHTMSRPLDTAPTTADGPAATPCRSRPPSSPRPRGRAHSSPWNC